MFCLILKTIAKVATCVPHRSESIAGIKDNVLSSVITFVSAPIWYYEWVSNKNIVKKFRYWRYHDSLLKNTINDNNKSQTQDLNLNSGDPVQLTQKKHVHDILSRNNKSGRIKDMVTHDRGDEEVSNVNIPTGVNTHLNSYYLST